MQTIAPTSGETDMAERLFDEMENARRLCRWQCSSDDESSEMSEHNHDDDPAILSAAEPACIHVCSSACPFMQIMPGGEMSCSLTGATNRITTSNEPNYGCSFRSEETAVGVPLGGWRHRRDAFRASQLAYIASKGVGECEPIPFEQKKEKRRRTVECVTISDERHAEPRDFNLPKYKESLSSRQQETLKADATRVFTEITRMSHRHTTESRSACADSADGVNSCTQRVKTALKTYLRDVGSKNQVPSLNTMHDICLLVRRTSGCDPFVSGSNKQGRHRVLENVLFLEAFGRLAVCMWSCLLRTPHFMQSKKKKKTRFGRLCVAWRTRSSEELFYPVGLSSCRSRKSWPPLWKDPNHPRSMNRRRRCTPSATRDLRVSTGAFPAFLTLRICFHASTELHSI